jgi:hypothetical protein
MIQHLQFRNLIQNYTEKYKDRRLHCFLREKKRLHLNSHFPRKFYRLGQRIKSDIKT